MVVIVRGRLPADEFALSHTLQSVPDLEFDVERIICTNDRSAMPLLWVRGDDAKRCEEAFEADPTVEEWDLLAPFEGERLYRMQWIDRVRLVVRMITNAGATVLDARGEDGRWAVRVMYPDRDSLSTMHEFCSDHGLAFEADSIRDMEGEPAGRYGLTNDQFKAITAAAERGLFDVPRAVTLEELADEMGISHQALSERIRRATGALVEDTLVVEAPS